MSLKKEHNVDATSEVLPPTQSINEAVERAKRAFALKKYEQSVDHYATALELATEKFGEDAPQNADLYFAYGKALLENAISQVGVLGKDELQDDTDALDTKVSDAGGGRPILSFSGDAEDGEGTGDAADDEAVDLFQDAINCVAKDEAEGEEEEDDDAEPEDDFNAAWEVLDLARAIYAKQKDEDEEIKLKLADTYITLGDVSLETEKFDQAIGDYEAGLALKNEMLPISSRHIAEAHYKLSMVLDLTSGRLSDAIVHAERAQQSVLARIEELQDAINGQIKPESRGQTAGQTVDNGKGKGKAVGGKLVRDDLVQNMTKSQLEHELKDLEGLKEDLVLKVEELKTSPNEPAIPAPVLAATSLDQELNGAKAESSVPVQVNDMTSMVVKKKKRAPETNGATKRKADDDAGSPSEEKKAKLEQ